MKFDINTMLGNAPAQANSVPLASLVPYHNHRFELYTGERLSDMVESVKNDGVLVPIIVCPTENNEYEILAGHNRVNAARIAGLDTIPAVIKTGLTEEEKEIYVTMTNVCQRGFLDLKLSERAAVIALRHSKMFDKAKQEAISAELYALENGGADESGKAADVKTSKLAAAGEEYGLCKNTVARLIRLNKLLKAYPDFTFSADERKSLPLAAAVELSYINKTALSVIYDRYKTEVDIDGEKRELVKISVPLAEKIRALFKGFKGTKKEAEIMLDTFNKCGEEQEKKPKAVKVKAKVIETYFNAEDSEDYVNDIIEKALKMYFESVEGAE